MERQFFPIVDDALDRLDPLHEAVILIAHFVFPGSEASARIDVALFQGRQHTRQSPVAIERRNGITVRQRFFPDAQWNRAFRDKAESR